MTPRKTPAEQRKERLAKALKANIARRKAAPKPLKAPPKPPKD